LIKEKTLTILVCVIGILAVSYGMIKDNTVVFIIGLLFVLCGYLILRKKLKESIRNKS
jgi:hypothetical protein